MSQGPSQTDFSNMGMDATGMFFTGMPTIDGLSRGLPNSQVRSKSVLKQEAF